MGIIKRIIKQNCMPRPT